MPSNEQFDTECAPWQPQAAMVLETYMRMKPLTSLRKVEEWTGLDRDKLGGILYCRGGVSINFWKRALVNLIAMAHHGFCSEALSMLEAESQRMDQVRYSLTPTVRDYIANEPAK